MRLDIDRLEKARIRGGKLVARCPACAEAGVDRRCEHLVVFEAGNGAYRCIADPDGAGSAHSKRICELAGVVDDVDRYFAAKRIQSARPRQAAAPADRPLPQVPPLRCLSVGETQRLAALRGWDYIAGLELMSRRGLLHYGEVRDAGQSFPSWVIADSSRRNVQARRLDGRPWNGIGGAKAKSLFGSHANWPIGAADIGDRPIVVLTEGMPDFCCALLVAWFEGLPTEATAPVTITGAGNSIHADALPLFQGKRVRIIEHRDAAGINAGVRWSKQLWQAGVAAVDGFRFDGFTNRHGVPVKDLADFATMIEEDNAPNVQILADLACFA